jgi:hypothetical protein
MCPKGSPRWDEAWTNVQKGLGLMVTRWRIDLERFSFAGFLSIAALLDKNGSNTSTLVMGKRLTFSDLVIAAFLETIFLINPEEWNARVRTWDGGRWEKLRDMCAEWRIVH